jgi:hypothetical protein
MVRFPFPPILLIAYLSVSAAAQAGENGTAYLENADALVGTVTTVIPKQDPKKPTPSPTPSPSPSPDPDDQYENEAADRHLLRHSTVPVASGPSRMLIGTELSVPTVYTPARIATGADGTAVVVPSSPAAFETRRLGTTLETGSGISFRSTELQGFIDYGSPIRTAVPAYDSQGRPVGTRILETPNPILQPVIQTIELDR